MGLGLFVSMVLAACSSDDASDPAPGGGCVQGLSLDCTSLYDPPIYPTLFEKVFKPTCASGVGTCHTGDAAKGGLIFENADTAYGLLLGTQGGKKRVLPGDAACSLLVERLESSEPTFRMPPGTSGLSRGERCAIEKWIANGAGRQ